MYKYSTFIVPWTIKYTEVVNLALDYILVVYVLLGLVDSCPIGVLADSCLAGAP